MVTRGCVLAVKYDGYGGCADTYFSHKYDGYGGCMGVCFNQQVSLIQWMCVLAIKNYGCSGCVFQQLSITAVADVCFSHRALRL